MTLKIHRSHSIIGAALLLGSLMPSFAAAQGFRTEQIEGRIQFSLGPTYNRVEGLPLTIGPLFQTRNAHPLRFYGLAIIRTETDPVRDFDQVGFLAAIEKDFGSHIAVGVSGWSRLKWVETRGISDLESSLGAVVFHDDRRDYYDALGIGVHGRYSGMDGRLNGIVTFRHERHRPVGATGVSSVFENGTPWRDQILAAEGLLHSMHGTLQWNGRPEVRDGPFNGWFAELDVLVGLGGNLEYLETEDLMMNPFQNFLVADSEPVRVILDVRRYFGFGDVEFNLRATGGGSLTDRPLVPQFQTALGGSGSLPGFPSFQLDCGARGVTLVPTRNSLRDRLSAYYGCDRHVMFQAEMAGYFGFAIGSEETRQNAFRQSRGLGIRLVPQWVIFADAGRGWSNLDGFYTSVRDEPWQYDVGGGIAFGQVGFYVAYPLDTPNAKARFTARLMRRF